MSRPVASYANITLPTCTVSGAKVKTLEGFEPTENESTAENRQVYYQVGCKTCGSLYYKAKGTLAKPHKCPSCRTEHPTINSYIPSKPEKKVVLLVINSGSFQLVEGEISDAVRRLSPENLATWQANGQKVAHPEAGGLFKVAQVKPMPTPSRFAPAPKPGPISLLDEPAPAPAQTPAQTQTPLPKPKPAPEFEKDPFNIVPRINWAEPIILNRTTEQERDAVDAEGYQNDLRKCTEFYNLGPHSPNRKTFNGWLVSHDNLENLQNKRPAYVESQLAEKAAGVKDLPNEFSGAPLLYYTVAALKDKTSRGWFYLYKYHEDFDPVAHALPIDELIKADLAGLSRAEETYRQWHVKHLAKEQATQEKEAN